MDPVLCAGPVGSGKSTLLNILEGNLDNAKCQEYQDLLSKTIATTGVDHFTFEVQRLQPSYLYHSQKNQDRRVKISLKELGGQIAPLWNSYIDQGAKSWRLDLIFVIDSSDRAKFSDAGVHLVEILDRLKESKSSRILIVFSKIDELEKAGIKRRTLNDLKHFLRIPDLKFRSGCEVTTLEFSALTGEGLAEIKYWLLQRW